MGNLNQKTFSGWICLLFCFFLAGCGPSLIGALAAGIWAFNNGGHGHGEQAPFTISPSEGISEGGTRVLLQGDFSFAKGNISILFGHRFQATEVKFLSSTKIECLTPKGSPGLADVTVQGSVSGSATLRNGFIYYGISPRHGSPNGGNLIQIQGFDFVPSMTVMIGNNFCSKVEWKDSSTLECTTPPSNLFSSSNPEGIGEVDIYIFYPDGRQAFLEKAFAYSWWRFQLPGVTPSDIRGMSAGSDKNVLAVGLKGKISHYDGFQWRDLPPPADQDFYGVWMGATLGGSPGFSYTAFIAGSQGIILRGTTGDGGKNWVFSTVQSPNASQPILRGISGFIFNSQFHIYACGDNGTVLKSEDGFSTPPQIFTSSSTGTSSNLRGVSAKERGEIFFCGDSGSLLCYNETSGSFTNLYSSISGLWQYSVPTLYSISVVDRENTSSKVIYLVGSSSGLPTVSYASYMSTVLKGVGSGGNYSWIRMSTGNLFSNSYSPTTLYSVSALTEKSAFACGSYGIFQSNDLGEWNFMPSGSRYWVPTSASIWSYYALCGWKNLDTTSKHFWVGGAGGRILYHSPQGIDSLPNQPHMWRKESAPSGSIHHLQGNSWNNVWAVGASGYAAQATSTGNQIFWQNRSLGGTDLFHGVWSPSPNRAFIAGEDKDGKGFIYYYNGRWNTDNSNPSVLRLPEPGSSMRSIYGISPEEIYACGAGGRIYYFNGRVWQRVANGLTAQDLNSIFATQGSFLKKITAVGKGGTGITSDGSIWTLANTGTTEDLNAIHGSDYYTIYAAGNHGTLLVHSDYGSWPKQSLPTTVDLKSISVQDTDAVYVGGNQGVLLYYNGYPFGQWSSLPNPVSTIDSISSVWGCGNGEMFLASSDGSLFSGNSHWKLQTLWSPIYSSYRIALYSSFSLEAWAMSIDGSSARRPPFSETWERYETPAHAALNSLWEDSSQIFAVGSGGTALRFDGTQWLSADTGIVSSLFWVWGTSSNNVYAVGENQTILRWNGSGWARETILPPLSGTPIGSTYDWLVWVGGRSSSDIWALGDRTIAYFDGSSWRFLATSRFTPSPPSIWMNNAWMDSSTGKIFAVGYSGQIVVYDGSPNGTGMWHTYRGISGSYSSGTSQNLWWVWGKNSQDVWAVGDGGTIVHWNGSAWSGFPSPTTPNLYCIWGDGGDNIYAVGTGGTVLRYQYSTGLWKKEIMGTDASFYFVTGKNGEVMVTGSKGSIAVK